ncbi:MAG: TIGR02757 family protein [Chitinophagales bacterium]
MPQTELFQLLESKVKLYNRADFVKDDPISIPHQLTKLQDIEIMGFWAAMLAWGLRKTIINKCHQLLDLMDGAPHDFICNHELKDLKRFEDFKHRTFNMTDTLYFIEFFKHYYQQNNSLETAFSQFITPKDEHVGNALKGFHELFFSLPDAPQRTRKHIATPARKSACKRLNMFLRWMVRKDNQGVDLGLWNQIKPAQLLCPLDVHVDRVGRKLGLIHRKQRDWKTVLELTANLRQFDPNDPVKYDFALFGIGVSEKNSI